MPKICAKFYPKLFAQSNGAVVKCGQKISTSVGLTKIRAFAWKCGQKISTSVGFTKIKAVAWKSGQNCANLLCRNNISRASPENEKLGRKYTRRSF